MEYEEDMQIDAVTFITYFKKKRRNNITQTHIHNGTLGWRKKKIILRTRQFSMSVTKNGKKL